MYANALTGQTGTITTIDVQPSQRMDRRNPTDMNPKVKTNRKRTNGRLISYQLHGTNGTIKHIQETPNALKRKTAMFELNEKILINKSKWHKAHPEYKKEAK